MSKVNNNEIKSRYEKLGVSDYALSQYEKDDGSFDYEAYVESQTYLNKRKIHLSGPSEPLIKQLCYYVAREFAYINHKPKFGLCHGTRRGHEQKHFSKHLNIPVLGTDISDTAEQFPNTIKWDFHEVPDEWINGVDFIYSNSLDHSYDPIHCLRQWFKCLRPGGICILAYDKEGDSPPSNSRGIQKAPEDWDVTDPFRGSLAFYEKIIKIAGELDGITGLKYILNTEYMGVTQPEGIQWDMSTSNWGLWDYHFVIQKISNQPISSLPVQNFTGNAT
tara:strand:- start:4978 stop:5805 length:828 start_codon:yes stop_codon:yes gene_type:complete